MTKYLYNFGYTTPGRPKDSDFEDSRRFFIIADTEEKALEWGNHLAGEYIKKLEIETKESIGTGPGWLQSEEELLKKGSLEHYSELPVAQDGEELDIKAAFNEISERHRERNRRERGERMK